MRLLRNSFLLLLACIGSATENKPLIVSLGSDCHPALLLEAYEIRPVAYPFDWLLSIDGNRFIELLDSNFKNYLEREYFTEHNNALVHSYYHIEFRHEHEGLEQLIAKQQRRVERFKELDSYAEKVFFIRAPYILAADPSLYWSNETGLYISEEEAQRLNHALKKLFPNLNYTLVVLNYGMGPESKSLGDILMVNIPAFEHFIPYFEMLLK